MDEISWFDTPCSGFLAALDAFWNQYCAFRNDIILVICGSSASWILNRIVNNKGGLHNRLTRTIELSPFSVNEVKEYLKFKKITLGEKDIVQLYMCIGGVPYYLNGVEKGKSVGQILNDLFFSKTAYFRHEMQNLYAALFKNYEIHEKIIAALSKSPYGLVRTDLLKKTKQKSGGQFSKALKELLDCGFVMKIQQLHQAKENVAYRLIDEYSLFYYKFIATGKIKSGQDLQQSQQFKVWSGYAFENFCFRHIGSIANALGISGIAFEALTYQVLGKKSADHAQKGAQVDLLFDRADNSINLFEIKYYDEDFKMREVDAKRIRKATNLILTAKKKKKSVFPVLITPYPAFKNQHYLEVNTHEINLPAFFKI